jgi:ribosome-associated protein
MRQNCSSRHPGDRAEVMDEGENERPSRSARKRAAESAQELGERLIALPESDLATLALPEPLADAVRDARRIRSRAAGARQRQYIGKLMRAIDCEPIVAALAAIGARHTREAQSQQRAESWRERLLTGGEPALAELVARYPAIDANEWRARVGQAGDRSGAHGVVRAAQRELFRALRELLG